MTLLPSPSAGARWLWKKGVTPQQMLGEWAVAAAISTFLPLSLGDRRGADLGESEFLRCCAGWRGRGAKRPRTERISVVFFFVFFYPGNGQSARTPASKCETALVHVWCQVLSQAQLQTGSRPLSGRIFLFLPPAAAAAWHKCSWQTGWRIIEVKDNNLNLCHIWSVACQEEVWLPWRWSKRTL